MGKGRHVEESIDRPGDLADGSGRPDRVLGWVERKQRDRTRGGRSRGRVLLGLAFAMLGQMALAGPAEAQTGPTLHIFNVIHKKCLGVDNFANGTPAKLFACDMSKRPGRGDGWEMLKDGHVRHKASGRCLDVVGKPGKADGAKIQIWDCEDPGRVGYQNTDQIWFQTGRCFVNRLSSKCLDVSSGGVVQLWTQDPPPRNGGPTDQVWTLQP